MSRKSKLGGSLGSIWLPVASLALVLVLAVPAASSAQVADGPPDTIAIPPAETWGEASSAVLAAGTVAFSLWGIHYVYQTIHTYG